jgi:hypothetical protein
VKLPVDPLQVHAICPSSGSDFLHACDDVCLDFMLPNPEYTPTEVMQDPHVSLVPLPVPRNLFLPERGKLMPPDREAPAMPEIAINENRDPCFPEYEVGMPWKPPNVLPEM